MGAELKIPDEAVEHGADILTGRVDTDRGYLVGDVQAVLDVAAPLIVAAELERLAAQPDPVARVAQVWLQDRASELRGER